MDLIEEDERDKRVKIVSQRLIEPNEPIRTYIYGPGDVFEIEELHVSGVILYATDDSLAPEIKKGMRLLVNTAVKGYEGNDCYVFDRGEGKPKEIAVLIRNRDGSFMYISDAKQPQRIPDLKGSTFFGKVHEAQIDIPFFGYANLNEKPRSNSKEKIND